MQFSPKKDVSIKNAIDSYLLEKEATGSFSASTIHNRRYELNKLDKFCISHKITTPIGINKNIMLFYLKSLKISNSTKLNLIFIFKGFMDYLINEELILDNIADIIGRPRIYPPSVDYLTIKELNKLFQSEAQNASRKTVDRNLLLFSLFTDICLRVSEVINLTTNDVRLDAKEVWVTRKGNKLVNIPINDDIVNKFYNWFAVRKEYKNNDLSWIFLSSHGKQLKPRQVHHIVSNSLERAGIVKRKRGPHLLRHSGASLKIQNGENIVMLQYLLGHENLNTTRRYLHFKMNELKQMIERSNSFNV